MRKLILSATILATLALSSCGVGSSSPIRGALFTDVESSVAVTSNSLGSKVGRAKATGILFVATGDASVQTAAKSAGIKRISHVDQHSTTILGLYTTYEIIVYGE